MSVTLIRNGDTSTILLNGYTVNGDPIEQGSVQELELSFADMRFTLTDNTVVWDENNECYAVYLSQEQTFTLPSVISYQLRVKKDGEVGGSEIEYLRVGASKSKEVI